MTAKGLFVSYLRTVQRMHVEIGVEAIRATCLVIQNQAKGYARGGFKTGRYVTTGWNLITHEVIREGGAGQTLKVTGRVGSTLEHFAYWELGHHNVFTGGYERSPWLAPAMQNGRILQMMAARRAVEQVVRRYRVVSGGVPYLNVQPPAGMGSRGIPR